MLRHLVLSIRPPVENRESKIQNLDSYFLAQVSYKLIVRFKTSFPGVASLGSSAK